jgi:magnesium transporter
MIKEYKHNKISWIDLENPTVEEVKKIADKYSVDTLVANELLSPTIRPRVEYYKNYIYLILHFPATYKTDDSEERIKELDFIIGKDFIITTRYSSIDALLEFSKIFEVQSILDKSDMSEHAGYIFYYMIQNLYKKLTDRLENIREKLNDAENEIFSGNEKQMVLELSKMNRLLLNYKESVGMHKEILESFEVAGKKFFGQDFEYHLHSVVGEYYKVRRSITGSKEYLDELRETNDSLLSTKQNEIMKILTVTNFTFLPLALVAGIFSMNTISTPLVGIDGDFSMVMLIMLGLAAGFYFFFRFKKWL